jgi:arylsulfatase A-like enzyme
VRNLAAFGLDNNTLIFLFSDNGPADLGIVDCDFIGSSGPFLGVWQKDAAGGGGGATCKETTWEGGHRVLGAASWPTHIDPGRISPELVSSLDILPTILSLAGVPLPTDRSFDGQDISALLLGNSDAAAPAERILFHPDWKGELHACRVGQYKFFWETYSRAPCNHGDAGLVLAHNPPLAFDLHSDPYEAKPVVVTEALLQKANRARDLKLLDIALTLSHTANYTQGAKTFPYIDSPCCNLASPVCRCTDQGF